MFVCINASASTIFSDVFAHVAVPDGACSFVPPFSSSFSTLPLWLMRAIPQNGRPTKGGLSFFSSFLGLLGLWPKENNSRSDGGTDRPLSFLLRRSFVSLPQNKARTIRDHYINDVSRTVRIHPTPLST